MVLRTAFICIALVVACSLYAVGKPTADGADHSAGDDSDALVLVMSLDRKTISVWTPVNSCFKHLRFDTPLDPPNVWIENGFCCMRRGGTFYAINGSSPNWTQITLNDEEMETLAINSHHIVASTERGTFVYGAKAVHWSGVSVSGDDIPIDKTNG